MEYIYLGDRNTDEALKKKPCSAVLCAEMGNALEVKTVLCWCGLKMEERWWL